MYNNDSKMIEREINGLMEWIENYKIPERKEFSTMDMVIIKDAIFNEIYDDEPLKADWFLEYPELNGNIRELADLIYTLADESGGYKLIERYLDDEFDVTDWIDWAA